MRESVEKIIHLPILSEKDSLKERLAEGMPGWNNKSCQMQSISRKKGKTTITDRSWDPPPPKYSSYPHFHQMGKSFLLFSIPNSGPLSHRLAAVCQPDFTPNIFPSLLTAATKIFQIQYSSPSLHASICQPRALNIHTSLPLSACWTHPHLHDGAASTALWLFLAIHLQFTSRWVCSCTESVARHFLVITSDFANDVEEGLVDVFTGLCGCFDKLATELSSEVLTLCW